MDARLSFDTIATVNKASQLIALYENEGVFKNKLPNITLLNDRPLVSVVVPTYDRYQELDESLKSIISQTYENIEVIVVDDNSPDIEMVKKICKDNNVKLVLSKDKLFKAAACNLGVKNSKGKYILFFDDDDLLHSDSIEKYVDVLERNSDVDICSGFCSVFENEEYINTGVAKSEYVSLALGNYASGNLISNYFGKGSFIIRRNSFDKIGGYDVDLKNTHMVDYRFYVKATSSGLDVHIVPRSMYFYRKNSKGSLYYESANDSMKLFDAKSAVFNTLKKKISPELHDMFGMLYFNHSYPRVQEKAVRKESVKWLSHARKRVNTLFEVDKSQSDNINILSSDKSLLCHVSIRYGKKELVINHKVDGQFQNEVSLPIKIDNWLHASSVSLQFEVSGRELNLCSSDLGIDCVYDISHVKQKHVRKIVMNTNFLVA